MKTIVYRIQDDEGRGPFRPGFSHRWADKDDSGDRLMRCPPVQVEFGWGIFNQFPKGMHCGCAFRDTDSLFRWFSQAELYRLKQFAYKLVELDADQIIAESKTQLVIARRLPFREGWRPLIL